MHFCYNVKLDLSDHERGWRDESVIRVSVCLWYCVGERERERERERESQTLRDAMLHMTYFGVKFTVFSEL